LARQSDPARPEIPNACAKVVDAGFVLEQD
jgi:hypothetical protein